MELKVVTVSDLVKVLLTLDQSSRLSYFDPMSDVDSRIFVRSLNETDIVVDIHSKAAIFGRDEFDDRQLEHYGLCKLGDWQERHS